MKRKNVLWVLAVAFSLLLLACNIKVTSDQADTYLDPLSGLEWQVIGQEFNSLGTATAYCASLTLAGHDDWRIPTIDDLRTLIRGCANTMTGGPCQVSDPDCLDESCQNGYCNGCGDENGPAPKGGFWDTDAEKAFVPPMKSLGNCSFWTSRSLVTDEEDEVWLIDFSSGEIYHDLYDYASLHCVRTATPLAVGDKCAEGVSFCRDNTAYNCVSEKLTLTEECSKNDKICYDDPVSGAGCLERPPAPVIGLQYSTPISGYKDHRVIKDWVNMDASLSCPMRGDLDEATAKKCRESLIVGSAVDENTLTAADFAQQCCISDWKDKYCLKFRWILAETPTPYTPETRISLLDNIWDNAEGDWYSTCDDSHDPTLASFKAYMLTPTPDGKEYKVQIEAKSVDRLTGAESDIATKIDAPNIIPAARVMVQLTWKEGFQTRAELDRQEGVMVDLDLHLIKKNGMDACGVSSGKAGYLCTAMSRPGLPIDTPTHDDCHWNELGLNGAYLFTDCNGEFKTIAWHAAFDLDNRYGGGDYTNPEVINLGPITDENPKDGKPDVNPLGDEYLVIVNYNNCQNLQLGGDDTPCQDGGEEYNVHAKVEIFVDGKIAPRDGKTDDDPLNRTTFVIRPREWIVVGTFTWDGALVPATPGWVGDAVVHNLPTTHEKICQFDSSHCRNVTIWDYTAYETWVTTPMPADDEFGGGDGTCYEYGSRQ